MGSVAPAHTPVNNINITWKLVDYGTTFQNAFTEMLERKILVDVTLTCENFKIDCHRVVLATCSPYFADIFSKNPIPNMVVCLVGIKGWQLEALVSFMYSGKVSKISREQLEELCAVAKNLKIQGLTPKYDVSESKDEQLPAAVERNQSVSTEDDAGTSGCEDLRTCADSGQNQRNNDRSGESTKRLRVDDAVNSYTSVRNPTMSIDNGDVANTNNTSMETGGERLEPGVSMSCVTLQNPEGNNGAISSRPVGENKSMNGFDTDNSSNEHLSGVPFNSSSFTQQLRKPRKPRTTRARKTVEGEGSSERLLRSKLKKTSVERYVEGASSTFHHSSESTVLSSLKPSSPTSEADGTAPSNPLGQMKDASVVGQHPQLLTNANCSSEQVQSLTSAMPGFNLNTAHQYENDLRLFYAATAITMYGLATNAVAAFYGVSESALTDYMKQYGGLLAKLRSNEESAGLSSENQQQLQQLEQLRSRKSGTLEPEPVVDLSRKQ